MAAIIKCDFESIQNIKTEVYENLADIMELIDEDEDSIIIEENNEGLRIGYPMGEIYGYTSDYVNCVANIFKKLKEKYTNIGIYGIVYEYETIQEFTYGPFFHCNQDDDSLTITFDWQECAYCGTVIEGDAFYNSDQKDFDEGNLVCLCSATCALEYIFDDACYVLNANSSLTEEEANLIADAELNDEVPDFILKEVLWNRIIDNIEAYKDEFCTNRDRILNILKTAKSNKEKVAVISRILKNRGDNMEFQPWMLAAMEEEGYMTTKKSLINRVAKELSHVQSDVIGDEEFVEACIKCNVDPYSFSQEDLRRLQEKLDQL